VLRPIVVLAIAGAIRGQSPGPEIAVVDKAYEALRASDYDAAIERFHEAIKIQPDRAALHTDLAYTLLKIGESQQARDQFGEAMRLEPENDHFAMEYAFLCYETKRQAIARRIFDRIRARDAIAAQAFENIDRPLREGIARWSTTVEMSPDNFSAHEELARLAEQHDELGLAGEHFAKAWRLKPDRRSVLLDLGRVWNAAGRAEDAMSALLAVSRGMEPRAAEEARELLPERYPYVYEFQKALELDPSNAELRRELAYLHLKMGNRADAEKEFQAIVSESPGDLAAAVQLGILRSDHGDSGATSAPPELRARPAVPVSTGAKEMAEKSLERGYLRDALKYLQTAHEDDPQDFSVILKLGWTYNNLKEDGDAVRWFDLARQSPDPKIAAEASKAYRNLKPVFSRLRTTAWTYPVFSTRWHDLFAYAQLKTELRLPGWFLHPFLSARFVGDSEGSVFVANLGAQYLSERSIIVSLGLATNPWHGMTGWFEAGESFRYSQNHMLPDYRGGVSFVKGWGGLLARGGHGFFAETSDDGLYVSRFNKDMLLYSQNRTGYTFRSTEGIGDFHAQVFWNWNVTADQLHQYWANYVETGPGVKFRFEAMPQPMMFTFSALRGAYLVNQGNPRRPNFNDVRIGLWYALSR
jgi:Tfp pilus assembly protein PilF